MKSYLVYQVKRLIRHERVFDHNRFIRYDMQSQVTQPGGIIIWDGVGSKEFLKSE